MTDTLSLETVPVKDNSVVKRNIADTVFLVPIKGKLVEMKRLLDLNETAEFLWDRIDGVRSLRAIARELTQTYEVEEASALADTTVFVERLHQAGAVTTES